MRSASSARRFPRNRSRADARRFDTAQACADEVRVRVEGPKQRSVPGARKTTQRLFPVHAATPQRLAK